MVAVLFVIHTICAGEAFSAEIVEQVGQIVAQEIDPLIEDALVEQAFLVTVDNKMSSLDIIQNVFCKITAFCMQYPAFVPACVLLATAIILIKRLPNADEADESSLKIGSLHRSCCSARDVHIIPAEKIDYGRLPK